MSLALKPLQMLWLFHLCIQSTPWPRRWSKNGCLMHRVCPPGTINHIVAGTCTANSEKQPFEDQCAPFRINGRKDSLPCTSTWMLCSEIHSGTRRVDTCLSNTPTPSRSITFGCQPPERSKMKYRVYLASGNDTIAKNMRQVTRCLSKAFPVCIAMKISP